MIEDLICSLQKCRREKALKHAKCMYGGIHNHGLEAHRSVGNYLVPLFVDCGSVVDAHQVFNRLVHRNEHSWTSLMSGFIQHGQSHLAFCLYQKMQEDNVQPSKFTLIALLKACSRMKDLHRGHQASVEIAQMGFDSDVFVGSALVDMYAKCGSLSEAQEAFWMLPHKNVVSWNTLISGYAENGLGQEALACFKEMQLAGSSPDTVTFVTILKACSSMGAIDKGREIHTLVAEKGLETDPFVGNTLIDMYAKCASLSEARKVFDKLQVQDVVSWTALIAGYAEHGPGQEALECFEQMQLEGISPNAVTYVCALKACGNIGAVDKGRDLHLEITQKGLEKDVCVASTLIDMYAKCGSLSEAWQVFEKLLVPNVVAWNALINGCGMNNEGKMAVKCFEDMQEQCSQPDAITFTCLLTACGRAKLVFEGQKYFNIMRETYGIIPRIDHYTCMVELFSRSGKLHIAEEFLQTIPLSTETWTSLLTGCKNYGNTTLGQRCFEQLVQMDPEHAASYVLMADIYSNAGRTDDVNKIEELRKNIGAQKKSPSAFIEVNKKVHEFTLSNNQNNEILAMLDVLNSNMEGKVHVSNLDLVLKSISDEEKQAALCEHAEKLALAYGLLNTPKGQTLRVTKTLRMCSNCHNGNKIISKIENREIIVRDGYCVHHFKDGVCSCRDVY